MKVRNVNLEWYAIRFNNGKIERFNVLSFMKENIANMVRLKKINNINELKEYLRHEFMYHYWSKTEAEIAIGGLFAKYPDEFEKKDIWYQLEMNLDRIAEYVNNAMEIFTKEEVDNEKAE